MLYSEKVKLFAKQHPCEEITEDGARYRYVLCGKAGARTLVFLNGGRFCGARRENSSDSSQSGLLFRKNAEGPDRAHARPEDRLRLRRAPVHCA